MNSISVVIEKHEEEYRELKLLERLVEPERRNTFRVTWVDSNGKIQVNRGYRVQFSSAIGSYKGGLLFHPSVNQSIINFLGLSRYLKMHSQVNQLLQAKANLVSILVERMI